MQAISIQSGFREGRLYIQEEVFGMTAKDAQAWVAALLIDWCDALVRLQIRQPAFLRLDGALLCPACGAVHGRCHEAVYPLLFLFCAADQFFAFRCRRRM